MKSSKNPRAGARALPLPKLALVANGTPDKPRANRTKALRTRSASDAHRKRAEVRAAVAQWLETMRSILNELQESAWALATEIEDNPTGEIANAFGCADDVSKLAEEISAADANALGLFLSPACVLPNPLAVAHAPVTLTRKGGMAS